MLNGKEKEQWNTETLTEGALRSVRITLENIVHMAFLLMDRQVEEQGRIERDSQIWLLIIQAHRREILRRRRSQSSTNPSAHLITIKSSDRSGYELKATHGEEDFMLPSTTEADLVAQLPELSLGGRTTNDGLSQLTPPPAKFNYWGPKVAIQFSEEEIAAVKAAKASQPTF